MVVFHANNSNNINLFHWNKFLSFLVEKRKKEIKNS
jgi:hypothetical protein